MIQWPIITNDRSNNRQECLRNVCVCNERNCMRGQFIKTWRRTRTMTGAKLRQWLIAIIQWGTSFFFNRTPNMSCAWLKGLAKINSPRCDWLFYAHGRTAQVTHLSHSNRHPFDIIFLNYFCKPSFLLRPTPATIFSASSWFLSNPWIVNLEDCDHNYNEL